MNIFLGDDNSENIFLCARMVCDQKPFPHYLLTNRCCFIEVTAVVCRAIECSSVFLTCRAFKCQANFIFAKTLKLNITKQAEDMTKRIILR